ncbi:MAG: sigma-70 family RNA polymerase sigma factor [Crocinitomicaceae bacterium]|nr:sigma-70 family RNA polymerase sigma factor [Crocinitomicaceae bacterium]
MEKIGGDSGNNDAIAKESFAEFFERYKGFLIKVCRKCCYSFDSSDQLADDVFQNTFIKVYHKAQTFKLKDPESTQNAENEIKAWLSRIAYHELINFLRENPDEKNLSNPFRQKSSDFAEIAEVDNLSELKEDYKSTSIEKNILDQALGLLTEREKYILLTYMQYFDPNQPLGHLPDDVLNGLCVKFEISPENARQIKRRSLKKLETEIEKIRNNGK